MFACFAAGRIASVGWLIASAFLCGDEKSLLSLLCLRSLSRADFSRGCIVESESVRPLASGDDDSLRVFSFRVRPVLGRSLTGLATDSAYRPVPSMGLSDSSASSTEATRFDIGSDPDIAS